MNKERITPQTLQTYQRDGFLHVRNLLKADEVAALREAVDRQWAGLGRESGAYDFQNIAEQVWRGEEDIEAPGATRFNISRFRTLIDQDPKARPLFDAETPGTQGRFFYEAAGWRRHEGIRRVACESALPEVCAALLESAYVNFWEDTTFIKSPGATARTAFHQDYTYFQITGRKCCIAWIALDETTPENGALEYVRGSHTWGQEFAPNLFIAQTVIPESPAGRLPDIEAQRSAYDIVQVCAKPGDVIFHDVMTVHGAGGNTTRDQMRRGISFRYCGDDIRYADKRGAIPQPWVSQKLADGDPIRDCPDYPLVWPKPA